jgi:hypothetical protein
MDIALNLDDGIWDDGWKLKENVWCMIYSKGAMQMIKERNKGAWYLKSFWSFGDVIYLEYGLKSGGKLGICYWFLFL